MVWVSLNWFDCCLVSSLFWRLQYFPDSPVSQDEFEHGHLILSLEGREAGVHLVYEHSKAPPVYRGRVAMARDHLGSQVVWGPAKRIGTT